MIFWKIFEVVMIFFQIFRKKSSRPRKFFKKLSKVTQTCASNPLTTYFGFRTFWWLFLNLSSFPWILKKKNKFFFKILNEFLRKKFFFFWKSKNHDSDSQVSSIQNMFSTSPTYDSFLISSATVHSNSTSGRIVCPSKIHWFFSSKYAIH